MIRVVLAVAVTSVLVAASLPAVDDAREDRTALLVERDLARLETAVASVTERAAPVPADTPGTRIVVDLVIPAATWTTAPVSVRVDGSAPRGHRVTFRIDGGVAQPNPIEGDFATPGGPLTFDAPGRHRLAVSYETRGGIQTATIRVVPTS